MLVTKSKALKKILITTITNDAKERGRGGRGGAGGINKTGIGQGDGRVS